MLGFGFEQTPQTQPPLKRSGSCSPWVCDIMAVVFGPIQLKWC